MANTPGMGSGGRLHDRNRLSVSYSNALQPMEFLKNAWLIGLLAGAAIVAALCLIASAAGI